MADPKSYKVAAPYVMLKLVQAGGGHVLNGFYKGAVVTAEVEAESLRHHLDEGLLVDEGAKEALLAVPAGTPDPGPLDEAPAPKRAAQK